MESEKTSAVVNTPATMLCTSSLGFLTRRITSRYQLNANVTLLNASSRIDNTIMGIADLVFAATAVAGALSSVRVTFDWEP